MKEIYKYILKDYGEIVHIEQYEFNKYYVKVESKPWETYITFRLTPDGLGEC